VARATRVARFVGARGSRRRSLWVGYADQGYVAVAAGAKQLISNFTLATLDSLTVIRNRGVISIIVPNAAADVDVVGAFGIGIVTQTAFTQGVASVPGPFSDSDWDGWMLLVPISHRIDVTSDVGRALMGVERVVDSKAMRKMEANEILVAVCESQANGFSVSAPIRTLVKLA